jgi:primosomal protein N' (replication factor Y)
MAKCKTKSLFGDDEDNSIQSGRVIRVAFDAGVDSVYDYLVEDSLWPVVRGQRVEVPFGRGNKPTTAFCVEIVDDTDTEQKSKAFRLKKISKVIDKTPLFDEDLLTLAEWISQYYVCPLGQVLSAMIPAAVKKGVGVKKQAFAYLPSTEIEETIKKLRSPKQKNIIKILRELNAFDEENGIEKSVLLEEADCTDAPLKRLIQNDFVKVKYQTVFHSPPAVPDSFIDESGNVILNEDQSAALTTVNNGIDSSKFSVALLYGVTGSGKTEVYIRSIQHAIDQGKTAIVLLPEIALTTQTINRFSDRFERIAVMHSQLTAAQRNAQWQKIRAGDADVVIGARSAVFAPLKNIGLIVVDEEHEPSYKQDNTPRYHGRDVAIKRAHQSGAVCMLGSATPSLESLVNCKSKEHYTLVELPSRVMDLPMPTMIPVDMAHAFKGQKFKGSNLISGELIDRVKEVIARKEQVILLLNRRGYSNFVFCPSCDHSLHCQNCDVTLTFHKRKGIQNKPTILGGHMGYGYAICHYCLAKTLVPEDCPLCKNPMSMIGLGSQRLEEEITRKLPDAKVARVDSDSMVGANYFDLLSDFAEGKIDILAGTQMLAKGLHFPNVTLVGIISADTALSLPDFRANERTFQLISQVAGRTGRSEKPGTVIVQTFMPDQPAIKFALNHDFKGFVRAELEHRAKCNLPPCWRMAIIHLKDTKFDRLTNACENMKERIDAIIAANALKIRVRGPMPATIARIHSFHRMQIILQAPDISSINRLFATHRKMAPLRPAVHISIDIDPINLM